MIYVYLIALAIYGALGLAVEHYRADAKAARADLQTVQANVTVLKADNASQAETIKRQNLGLEALEKAGQARARAAAAADARAKAAEAKQHDAEARLAGAKPIDPSDLCKSACAALRDPLQ